MASSIAVGRLSNRLWSYSKPKFLSITGLKTNLCQQNIIRPFARSSAQKEDMDKLKKNAYYEKYADKIAKLQKSSPAEFLSRLSAFEEDKSKKSAPKESGKDFSLPTKPKTDISKSETSMTTQKKLSEIMKVELLKDKSKDEIADIWSLHHSKKDGVSAIIPADTWELMKQRFLDYKTFLFPLPRKDGYEFIVVQFLGNDAHFTTLINFQAHQENAPECLTLTHYTELLSEKEIVLMVGKYDKNILSIQEAQCLANQVEMYYSRPSEEKKNLLETFTKSPDKFKHADLIEQLETVSLLAAAPKKN